MYCFQATHVVKILWPVYCPKIVYWISIWWSPPTRILQHQLEVVMYVKYWLNATYCHHNISKQCAFVCGPWEYNNGIFKLCARRLILRPRSYSYLAPLKYVIGRWTRPGTTLVYIENFFVRVTLELEVSKRPIFKPTLSIVMLQGFLQWERQKKVLSQKSGDHGKEKSNTFP